MHNSLKKLRIPAWAAPLALLLLCAVAYLPLIWRLGFYWDDWPAIWVLDSFGPSGFQQHLAVDRPLLAWLYMLTTPWLGETPLPWQVFAVFARWLSALALWGLLLSLWPKRYTQVTAIAFLFAVYPGFGQQFISVTYSHAFLIYALFLFSLWSMLLAVRRPRWFWLFTLLGLLSSALNLFIVEYFFGLELLRPLLLWMVDEQERDPVRRARRALKRWLPYLAVVLAFLVWRVFLHDSPRGELTLFSELASAPLLTAWTLLKTVVQDSYESGLLAWIKTLDIRSLKEYDAIIWAIYAGIVAGALLVSSLTLWLLPPRQADGGAETTRAASKSWALQAIALGLGALLLGGWPIWVTNWHIELAFPWDRFTLPMMVGASILLVGAVELLARARWQSALILGVVTGLAAGMQFQTLLVYRQEWLAQSDFFRQLAWRAPGIQPGTLLLTSELPFRFYSDNSLNAPLNSLYAPENSSPEMAYLLYNIESRLGRSLPSLEPGVAVEGEYRAASFNGSTSQALVLFYDPPRCLKVLDPLSDRNWPQKPLYMNEALALSNPGLIVLDPAAAAVLPEAIFGPQPAAGWCEYFQKAELARQRQDWEQVAALGDQALKQKKKFFGAEIAELTPYIEGYAHTGNWPRAFELTQQAYQVWPSLQALLCGSWEGMVSNTPDSPEKQDAFAKVQNQLNCEFP